MKIPFSERFIPRSDQTEPERQRRSTIVVLLVGSVLSGGLYAIGRVFNPADPIVPAAGVITLVTVAGFILALLGAVRIARVLAPTAVMLGVFYLMWTGQGLHDIAISGFGITLVFAGLMLGSRGPLIFSILASLGVAGFGYLEANGLRQYELVSGVFEGAAISLTTIGAGVFLYILLSQFEQSLARIRQSAQAQIKANQELRDLQTSLEQRVTERTASLQRRSAELEAAAQVARAAATASDLQSILNNAVRLISEQFGYYFAGIFLIDENREAAVLTAASSEGGRRLLERGFRVRIGAEGLVGNVAATRRPRIIADVNRDIGFARSPDLPQTRAEMALPLIGREGLIGVLDIQSAEGNAFQSGDLDILQTLADQLATAIQNTRLLAESRALITQLEAITARDTRKAWRERIGREGRRVTYSASGISLQTISKDELARTARLSPRQRTDIPILVRGQRIGRISMLRDDTAPAWNEEDKNMADEIARQIGLALENARLTEEARQRAAREQMISVVSARMRETLDLDTVLQTATQEMLQSLDLREVEIRLGRPEKEKK